MITSVVQQDRRQVVTGIGVVAPNGVGTERWWKATLAGETGIGQITRFDPSKYACRLAGEVQDFVVGDWVERRLQVQTDRWTQMAMAATQMAFEDGGFTPADHDGESMSVVTASSSGGNEFGQREIQSLWAKGPGFVGAYQSIAWFYAATTGQISIRHGMKGPCGVVLAEGAGGLEALQHARRTLRRGVDTVVSGGLEAPISPYALTCQMTNGCLSTQAAAGEAYRPFDARANGYVPGEGGAILLLDSLERARARGAPQVYGELVGYGATQDAHHWRDPARDPRHRARAMRIALDRAGIGPGDVDAIFADGFGVPAFDRLEADAIRSVFGRRAGDIPVTVPKTMVGRLYAGGASLDVAAALLAMRDGVLPPTVNVEDPAEGVDLDLVTGTARRAELSTVLVNAHGFGGFNSTLVLRRGDGTPAGSEPDA